MLPKQSDHDGKLGFDRRGICGLLVIITVKFYVDYGRKHIFPFFNRADKMRCLSFAGAVIAEKMIGADTQSAALRLRIVIGKLFIGKRASFRGFYKGKVDILAQQIPVDLTLMSRDVYASHGIHGRGRII